MKLRSVLFTQLILSTFIANPLFAHIEHDTKARTPDYYGFPNLADDLRDSEADASLGNKGLGDFTAKALPAGSIVMNVNVVKSAYFTASELKKLAETKKILLAVINSNDFRQGVLNHVYLGKYAYSTTTHTNQQILDRILSGKETLNGIVDHEMDLTLSMYYKRWSSVVGYTGPSYNTIYINRKFYSYSSWYTASYAAGNFMHEWLHKVGYGHDSNNTTRRPKSVPYAIGYLMTELAKKYYNGTLK